MKYYYALNIFLLNICSHFIKKSIGLNNTPLFILDWFLKKYIYNLTKLADLLNDNEALQKIELVSYWYDNKEEK